MSKTKTQIKRQQKQGGLENPRNINYRKVKAKDGDGVGGTWGDGGGEEKERSGYIRDEIEYKE